MAFHHESEDELRKETIIWNEFVPLALGVKIITKGEGKSEELAKIIFILKEKNQKAKEFVFEGQEGDEFVIPKDAWKNVLSLPGLDWEDFVIDMDSLWKKTGFLLNWHVKDIHERKTGEKGKKSNGKISTKK